MIKENYIHRLQRERDEALEALEQTDKRLREIQAYLMSAKFCAPDSDYVFVSTDILPKIKSARLQTIIF